MATAQTIREYHDRRDSVVSVLNRARPWLNLAYIEAWPSLVRMRGDLSAAMQVFQTLKHQKLFDPLLKGGSRQQLIAAELKADCIKLGVDYVDFQRKWSTANVEARWPEYRLSAIAMMTTIRKAIADQDVIIRKLETLVSDRSL
jgi:hypothetical protein